MKKYIVILILFIGLLYTNQRTIAQDTVIYVYDTSYKVSYHDTIIDMTLTPSGDLLVMGITDNNDATFKVRSQMFISKIRGATGDSLNFTLFEFDTTFSVYEIAGLSDGNYMIPGSFLKSGRILTISENGDLIDEFNVPDSTNFFSRILEMPNNDIVAIQSNVLNKNFSKVLRFNRNTPTWDTIWNIDFTTDEFKSVKFYNEDRIIVTGWDNNFEYPHPTLWAFQPNDGEFMYYNKLNEIYAFNLDIIIDSSKFYFVNTKEYLISGTVGNIVLTDDEGNFIWYEDLDSPGSPSIASLRIYNDYLIAASETQGINSGILISIIQAEEGTLINSIIVPKLSPKVNKMLWIGDQLIIAGTQSDTSFQPPKRKVFVTSIMIDTSWFTITVGKQELASEHEVSIYPNPSTGTINIAIEKGDPFEEKTALLFNSSGLLVEEFRFTGTHYQSTIDHLTQGLYFVKLVLPDGTTNTQKIVLMR